MIEGYEQPDVLEIDEKLRLVKYYPDYDTTLRWYQDPDVCRQVDNIDHVYDLGLLTGMYSYLSTKGECYYLQLTENGKSVIVGDISLWDGNIAIVVSKPYQNRHLGRKAIMRMLDRAREIGWTEVKAEIYDFNAQSRTCFTSVGFRQVGREQFIMEL